MIIILYVLDALRADHLSCYGYERETSPNIDRIAAEGAIFRNCFTPATWTRPVAASILSGAYPSTHGTQTRTQEFSARVPRLPEFLGDAGFDVAAFSAMANISIAGGFGQGFEEFVELFRDEDLIARRRTSTTVEEGVGRLEGDHPIALPRSEDINDRLFHWLGRGGHGNAFAFIWSIDTHAPYDPPSGFDKFVDKNYTGTVDGARESIRRATEQDAQRLMDLYDGEITYNDYQIGQLTDELRQRNLYDDSLIIITGDHGEAFYDHGLFSHGNVPYEELIHVPLIIKCPGGAFAGCEITALVELIDLCPTILEWAGVPELCSLVKTIQGRNLLPLLRGEQSDIREFVYSETRSLDFQNTYLSIRSQQWKYIETRVPPRTISTLTSLVRYTVEQRLLLKILRNPFWFLRRHRPRQSGMLFDLTQDALERHDVLSLNLEEGKRLRDRLVAWHQENQALAKEIDLQPYSFREDAAIRRHLEELGYL